MCSVCIPSASLLTLWYVSPAHNGDSEASAPPCTSRAPACQSCPPAPGPLAVGGDSRPDGFVRPRFPCHVLPSLPGISNNLDPLH